MTFLDKVQQAKQLISESIQKYPKIVFACSFGKDSMVSLHLIISVKKDIPVFCVLSNTEFPETYEFAKKTAAFYHLNYTEYHYNQVGTGAECCGAPKVAMFKKALASYDAWFSGIRKNEGITRVNFEKVEDKGGLIKINPILDFTELDVWRYLAIYDVPVNPKYRDGYRSLSCALCSTKEIDESESERAGRWKGTIKEGGECGIHTSMLR